MNGERKGVSATLSLSLSLSVELDEFVHGYWYHHNNKRREARSGGVMGRGSLLTKFSAQVQRSNRGGVAGGGTQREEGERKQLLLNNIGHKGSRHEDTTPEVV